MFPKMNHINIMPAFILVKVTLGLELSCESGIIVSADWLQLIDWNDSATFRGSYSVTTSPPAPSPTPGSWKVTPDKARGVIHNLLSEKKHTWLW